MISSEWVSDRNNNVKHKNPTLDDVARQAGVSYQMVSRVLNGSAHVAEATRARVEDAIKTLNYVPNRMAQQLAGKRGCTLGLITASLGFHAPSQIASAIKGVAGQCGYNVLIAMTDQQHATGLQDALNELKAQRVEGVIINLPLEAESAAQIVAANPELLCLFLDVPPDAGVFHVMFNPGDGMRASVDHLYRLGHRDFALLAGPQESVSARQRLVSWQQALEHYGLQPVATAQGDWSAASGYRCIVTMREAQVAFTAVLVANDQMALGAVSALQQQQLAVPEHVSVIGYDDTEDSAYFLPALTTVSQDFNRLGQEAVNRLLARLAQGGAARGQSMMLPTHLVVRHSITPCAGRYYARHRRGLTARPDR